MNALVEHYEISQDWDGKKYCGLTLEWDHKARKVHVCIPGYVQDALQRFNHDTPQRQQDQPHPHTPPEYGAKLQYAKGADDSPLLAKADKKFVQQVTDVFLFYTREVDSTMLTATSAIASEQAAPTENMMKKCKQLLDYADSQEEAILTYKKSDMVLAIHSNASYLSE